MFLGWTNPTGDFREQEQVSLFLGGAEQSKNEPNRMNQIQLYANTTPSDLEFMRRDPIYFPSASSTSTSSSTASDAQSAPPDLEK